MEAMGNRKKFPSIKSYLKGYIFALVDHEETVAHLHEYGAGVSPRNYRVIDVRSGLKRFSVHASWHGIQGALDEFERAKRPQRLRMQSLRSLCFCLGNCVSLGWFNYAKNLAEDIRDALRRGFIYDIVDPVCRCHIQYFVLQLVLAWQESPGLDPAVYAREEPLYETLLAQWNRAEAAELTPWLLAACDRHTHEARVDNRNQFFELARGDSWYVPYEVLSVLRLREKLALSTETLQHPLMSTPLGSLLPVTRPHSDELLDSVLPRAGKELRQFLTA